MHILCAICSDLVNQAENIYVTKCGHIFHYQCLAQWIERSQTCPQCRNKVTNRCMFRMFPTISNEGSGEDVATLQSRLDDAQLQLRQNKTQVKEKDDKITAITADLKKNEDVIKSLEKKLVSRESAVSALKEQLEYVKLQTKETQKLREDNESLRKNIQTMHGLQKVLNATTEEVEEMLQGYNDVRTIATFATALKRALCESESKKKESRDKLHETKQQLTRQTNTVAELQAKVGHNAVASTSKAAAKRPSDDDTSAGPAKKPKIQLPSDAGIKMAIIPEDHPNRGIERSMMADIQSLVFDLLEATPDPLPVINICNIIAGALRITCENERSVRWLKKLNGEKVGDITLKVVTPNSLPKPVKMAWKTRNIGYVETNRAMEMLHRFNPNLRTKEWKIVNTSVNGSYIRRIIIMDSISANIIKKARYCIDAGVDRSTFKIVEK